MKKNNIKNVVIVGVFLLVSCAAQAMKKEICSIKGLDKVEVLRALYAEAKPLGLGWMDYESGGLTHEEGERKLSQSKYIDYLKGRCLKVDLSGDELKTSLYNREYGKDVAEKVIENLRKKYQEKE